jgi:hypothetical protein
MTDQTKPTADYTLLASISCGSRRVELRTPRSVSGAAFDLVAIADNPGGPDRWTGIGLHLREARELVEALRAVIADAERCGSTAPSRRSREPAPREPGRPPASFLDMQRAGAGKGAT